jgi:hypothetical protein
MVQIATMSACVFAICYAYVYYQQKKEDGTLRTSSVIKLFNHVVSTCMQSVVPRKQLVKLRPAQMLRFVNGIPDKILTNQTIELVIELVDINSGQKSTGALASRLQVEIFVTRGNFPSNQKKLRNCKPLCPRNNAPMLSSVQATGSLNTIVQTLHEGRAVVQVKITDHNSTCTKSKKFKLVARVLKGSYQGRRIKGALSDAFTVNKSGRKAHIVPSPTDPTRKLINVEEECEKRLQAIGINTVLDFLNKLESDPEELKRILGMQNKKWEDTVEHARQCRVNPEEVLGMIETNGELPVEHMETYWGDLLNDLLLNDPVPNADLQRGPEIQAQHMGMGQAREPEECFGSALHFQCEASQQMPEQPSTGQGMTMDNEWEDFINCSALLDGGSISNDDHAL